MGESDGAPCWTNWRWLVLVWILGFSHFFPKISVSLVVSAHTMNKENTNQEVLLPLELLLECRPKHRDLPIVPGAVLSQLKQRTQNIHRLCL